MWCDPGTGERCRPNREHPTTRSTCQKADHRTTAVHSDHLRPYWTHGYWRPRIRSRFPPPDTDATNATPRNTTTSSNRRHRQLTTATPMTNEALQSQTSAHLRWRLTGGPAEAGGEGVGSWPIAETSWGFNQAKQTEERRQKCPNRTSQFSQRKFLVTLAHRAQIAVNDTRTCNELRSVYQ